MDMKRDLSCKICGTREFFVPFRENQWYRNYRLNSAAGCIRCVTFLSWLTITKKLEPKNRMRSIFLTYFNMTTVEVLSMMTVVPVRSLFY